MARFYTGLRMLNHPPVSGFPFHAKSWTYDAAEYDAYPGLAGKRSTRSHRRPTSSLRKEVVIDAANIEVARRANDLLWAAFTVVTGGELSIEVFNLDQALTEEAEAIELNRQNKRRYMLETSGVALASEIAAKASFRRSLIYACMKIFFSQECCTTPMVDLDPNFATETFGRTKREVFHVQLSQAIVLAYGAIEELGLEVRASNQKPSVLPDGSWNPAVKQDLENRLRKAGVDLAECFNWNIRGAVTRLERNKPRQIHKNATKSPWTRWNVRDRMVDVVDAIAHTSWLRSQVSSHRLKADKAGLLTVYDVANSQYLARRLIFERVGIWKREQRLAADDD